MCLTFPTSLKGVASDWFYFLPPHSLYNFEEASEAFLTQYVSRREAKMSHWRLLTIKMRQSDNLKPTSATFKVNWPKSPIAVKMSLHSLSSPDCKFLTLGTNIS